MFAPAIFPAEVEPALTAEFFQSDPPGFFVDVGAHDPVAYSQSYDLEQRGWAGILVHLSLVSVAWGVLLFLGALVRMLAEERLVKQRYPEYVEYSRVTSRMIPHVF